MVNIVDKYIANSTSRSLMMIRFEFLNERILMERADIESTFKLFLLVAGHYVFGISHLMQAYFSNLHDKQLYMKVIGSTLTSENLLNKAPAIIQNNHGSLV